MKLSGRGAIVLLAVLVTAGDLRANDVHDLPLEKKARLSDLVVIGRVESTRIESFVGASGYRYARVHIDSILKGKPPERLDVMFGGSIAEENPDCCEVGKTYLFFLVKDKSVNRRSDGFESVNGPHGIYPIPAR
jgi:hypothetical protein